MPKKEITELSDIELDEISLVDAPANRGAKVLLFKRDGESGGLISKCLAAVERGDVNGLSQEQFEQALDALAKQHASQIKCTFHKAYDAALASAEGRRLYQGYTVAASRRPVDLTKRDAVWAEIERRAEQRREHAVKVGESPLTHAQAVQRTIIEQPELYDAYNLAAEGGDAA
jgi:hypothetical protein